VKEKEKDRKIERKRERSKKGIDLCHRSQKERGKSEKE